MTATTPTARSGSPGLPRYEVLLLGIVTLALLALLVTAGLMRTNPAKVSYPEGSPEAAFQAYVAAFVAGDDAAAYGTLSRRARIQLSSSDYASNAHWVRQERMPTVRIVDALGSGERVTLVLEMDWGSGSGSDRDRWREQTRLPMVREDGTWKIDQPFIGLQAWFD